MEHSFDIDLANEIGIEEAIIFKHIVFWIEKNRANGKNFFDGEYWTYNSTDAFREIFFYMSPNKVRTALEKLRRLDYIKTGNFNSIAYDRTTWYAIGETGKSICENHQIHLRKSTNGSEEIHRPIPDIKPYKEPDINTDNISVSKDTDRQTRGVRHDIDTIVSAWNDLVGYGIPAVSRMSSTSKRYQMLKARLSEYGVEKILEAIRNVKTSDFLLGRHGGRPWSITFDWFVLPNNFPKVLEGNYKNKDSDSNVSSNASSNTSNHVASSVVVTNNNPVISPIDLSEYDIYGNRRQ